MRYVPIAYVKEGMILGKTLYGEMGEILLREGTTILNPYINKIKRLGYSGVYIEDKLSEDIAVKDIINEELKMKTIKQVKNLMQLNENNYKEIEKTYDNLEELVGEIIDDISSNEDIMVNMMDLKVASNYTFYHSVNVSVLSIILGIALSLPKQEIYLLGISSLLHDIGKMFTPKKVLEKPGKLDPDELQIVRKHSEDGYNYIKKRLNTHTKVYMGVYEHHERFDGSGYPRKTKGKQISLFGRIIAITDVYDALTSDRPYRKGILPSEGMEYIMGAGDRDFDYDIVKAFSKKIAPYPIGTCVGLSNDCTAIVVKNYSTCCLRPLVKVIQEQKHNVEPYYLNLKDSFYNITITGVKDALSSL